MASDIILDQNQYSDLFTCLKNDDSDNVLKLLGDPAISKSVFETECLIVAYIKKGLFSEAIDIMNNSKDFNYSSSFLRMYSLYKKRELSTVLDFLKSLKDLNIQEKDLLCQTLYQLEDFDSCVNKFEEFKKNNIKDDYEAERNTNMIAAFASNSLWLQKETNFLSDIDPKSLKSFEEAYNYASYYIGVSRYQKAIAFLDQADELIEIEIKEQNLTPDEINNDKCILWAQRAFVLFKLHEPLKAKELLASSLKLCSNYNYPIILSNLLVLTESLSWFDVRKKMKNIDKGISDSSKFSTAQLKTILFNQFIIYDSIDKFDLAKSIVQTYKLKFGTSDEYFALMDVFSMLKTKTKQTTIIEYLENFIKSNKNTSILINFTLFELARAACDKPKCESILCEISKKYINNTILIYYTAFYLQTNFGVPRSLEYLHSILAIHNEQNIKNADILYLVSFLSTKNRDFISGLKYLQELRSISKNDSRVDVLSKLYESINVSDQNHSSYIGLSSTDLFPQGFDLDALEASLSSYRRDNSTLLNGNDAKASQNSKPKPKRKRKNKLPKHMDPSIQPNPERWLPKYERTNYKPKKRDKSRSTAKGGLQGAASVDSNAVISNNISKTAQTQTQTSKPPAGMTFKSKGRNRR